MLAHFLSMFVFNYLSGPWTTPVMLFYETFLLQYWNRLPSKSRPCLIDFLEIVFDGCFISAVSIVL